MKYLKPLSFNVFNIDTRKAEIKQFDYACFSYMNDFNSFRFLFGKASGHIYHRHDLIDDYEDIVIYNNQEYTKSLFFTLVLQGINGINNKFGNVAISQYPTEGCGKYVYVKSYSQYDLTFRQMISFEIIDTPGQCQRYPRPIYALCDTFLVLSHAKEDTRFPIMSLIDYCLMDDFNPFIMLDKTCYKINIKDEKAFELFKVKLKFVKG